MLRISQYDPSVDPLPLFLQIHSYFSYYYTQVLALKIWSTFFSIPIPKEQFFPISCISKEGECSRVLSQGPPIP